MRSNSGDELAERSITGLLADLIYCALMSLVRHGAIDSPFKSIFGWKPAKVYIPHFEVLLSFNSNSNEHAPVMSSNRVFALT